MHLSRDLLRKSLLAYMVFSSRGHTVIRSIPQSRNFIQPCGLPISDRIAVGMEAEHVGSVGREVGGDGGRQRQVEPVGLL